MSETAGSVLRAACGGFMGRSCWAQVEHSRAAHATGIASEAKQSSRAPAGAQRNVEVAATAALLCLARFARAGLLRRFAPRNDAEDPTASPCTARTSPGLPASWCAGD